MSHIDNLINLLNLLRVDGIVRQLCQMHKFQVKCAKFSQDAAPSGGPAPAPTGATAKTRDRGSIYSGHFSAPPHFHDVLQTIEL